MRGMELPFMRVLMVAIVLMHPVVSQTSLKTEHQKCWEMVHPSSTSWFLREYYMETFGIVANVSKFHTLDVRKTNVFQEIQPLQWDRGTVPYMVYKFLQKVIGRYLEAVVDGGEREWNEETYDYDLPDMKKDMKGTVEEIIRFMAKSYEHELSGLKQVEITEGLKRLENDRNERIFEKDVEKYLNRMFEKIMNPNAHVSLGKWYYDAVAYQEWTGQMGDRLRDHLKNKVFFQKTEDNPLNGGHDVLTFLAINPKVLQSEKVNPLLRMALTKDIMDTKDFGDYFFKFLDCFLSCYGDSSFFQLFGLSHWQLRLGLEDLSHGYNTSFNDEGSKDNSHWVELADAIFEELKILDGDDLLYKVYLAALKIKAYLLKIDVENRIYPQYQKIKHMAVETYYWLLQNPTIVIPILKILQNDTFWDEGHVQRTYAMIIRDGIFNPPTCDDYNFWGCFGRLFPSLNFRRDFRIPLKKVFKLEKGDTGRREFGATKFFRNYRKSNEMSFFQLDVDFLHPEARNEDDNTNVGKLVDYLATRVDRILRFVKLVFLRPIQKVVDLKDTDLAMFRDINQKTMGYWREIQEELKK